MRFNELAQNAEEDNYNKWDIDDTRRPRLTLRHLNKMRNMRELSKKEHAEKVKNYKTMYGSASEQVE
jgi:hypothetical protein